LADFLQKIIEYKKREVERKRKELPLDKIMKSLENVPPPADFTDIFKNGKKAIIAEIKRASPSRGVIKREIRVEELAVEYESGGADGISVLTDEKYFMGSLEDLKSVKKTVKIPVLRKDFIIDEYQVYESRACGADAFLLIVRILSPENLKKLIKAGRKLKMEPLVEVFSEEEIKLAVSCGAKVIGINNRNLSDFSVDINRTINLAPLIPSGIYIISESGINQKNIKLLSEYVHGFLIGEFLMKSRTPSKSLKKLINALLENKINPC
jgi:indole-3-glycerol phosphate synthase